MRARAGNCRRKDSAEVLFELMTGAVATIGLLIAALAWGSDEPG